MAKRLCPGGGRGHQQGDAQPQATSAECVPWLVVNQKK